MKAFGLFYMNFGAAYLTYGLTTDKWIAGVCGILLMLWGALRYHISDKEA